MRSNEQQTATRWLAALLVSTILVTGTVSAGSATATRASEEPILYEIFLVAANEQVIGRSNEAVLRAAQGEIGDLVSLPGADTGSLRERLREAEAQGALLILAAPRMLTRLGEQAQAQTGIQLPIQVRLQGNVSNQYINATLRVQLEAQRSSDGLLNLEVRVQKQLPLFDQTYPGPGRPTPIETVDQVAWLVVRDGGTAVLGGFHTMLRGGVAEQIPELVLLVTPTVVGL